MTIQTTPPKIYNDRDVWQQDGKTFRARWIPVDIDPETGGPVGLVGGIVFVRNVDGGWFKIINQDVTKRVTPADAKPMPSGVESQKIMLDKAREAAPMLATKVASTLSSVGYEAVEPYAPSAMGLVESPNPRASKIQGADGNKPPQAPAGDMATSTAGGNGGFKSRPCYRCKEPVFDPNTLVCVECSRV